MFDEPFRESELNPCKDQTYHCSHFCLGQSGITDPGNHLKSNNWNEGCDKKDGIGFQFQGLKPSE